MDDYRCLRTGNRAEMALLEKEKVRIIEAILEGEEEVKVTPPARRKKAERKKAKENVTQRACEDDTKSLNGEDISLRSNDVSSLTAKKDGTKPSRVVLSSQVDVIKGTESHETENGMLEISISAEVKGNESPFGNRVENSIVEAKQFGALANETDSKENEEVATALKVLSDIIEEPSVHLESCMSPDITSQDEESFFSAEEAETTSESLPTEIVNETATESETSQDLPSANCENTNRNEGTASNAAQGGQEFSRTPITDSIECANELLPKAAEDLNKLNSCDNHNILSKNSDQESQTTEIAVFDDSITNSSNISETVTGESPGAVGGEADTTDSEVESSSTSNTSSEGEYDVGYFELKHAVQVSNYCG